ncbi:MAG TPA: hypothetical protein VGD03_07670 [Frankiaceae bacterium]
MDAGYIFMICVFGVFLLCVPIVVWATRPPADFHPEHDRSHALGLGSKGTGDGHLGGPGTFEHHGGLPDGS